MRRPFSNLERWPLVVARAPAPSSRWGRVTGFGLGLLLVGLALATHGVLSAPLRALVAAIAVLPLGFAARPSRKAHRASGTVIEANATGLVRVASVGPVSSGDATTLLEWDRPFGVTLLASFGRPVALLAFTSRTQTRYVPVRIDDRTELDDELFAKIAVLADLDLVDGVAHEAALTSASGAAIVRHVASRDEAALSRAFLSDGRMKPISLDRATLSVGAKTFDLTSPLEWRSLMFHESAGQGAALYQATRITQGSNEVVLVAPMPASIVPREGNAARDASGRLGRALTRHLKLLQAPAETPPVRDLRVAIDRPFMLAVRRILDEAPLALRVVPGPTPPRPRNERRGSLA
jgi:hypothetical protein